MNTSNNNIVVVASQAGVFKTLCAAVGAAGLVDTLQSAGPFTVFAPTDEAFAKLPEGTVETLLNTPPCAAAPATARRWRNCAATSRAPLWPTSA